MTWATTDIECFTCGLYSIIRAVDVCLSLRILQPVTPVDFSVPFPAYYFQLHGLVGLLDFNVYVTAGCCSQLITFYFVALMRLVWFSCRYFTGKKIP